MQIHFLARFPFDALQKSQSNNYPLYTYTYVEFGGVKRTPRSSLLKRVLKDLIILYRPIQVTTVANEFNKELANIQIQDLYAEQLFSEWHFITEPFQSVYFAKDRYFISFAGDHMGGMKKGNLFTVLFLFILAVLILAISCINVINLSTARSVERAKEIAVRKVMGADRSQLILQFLTESILLSFIALLFSFSMLELLLPGFNHILNQELTTDTIYNWGYIRIMTGIALFAGFFSGLYPAFFLSSFPALKTMQGETLLTSGGLRKWLMIFQLTASISILIFSFILSQGSGFLSEHFSNFEPEQIVFFNIDDENMSQTYPHLKKELLIIPNVSNVAASSLSTWEKGNRELFSFSTQIPISISLPPIPATVVNVDQTVQAELMLVDQDFLKLYGIPIMEGNSFSDIKNSTPSETGKSVFHLNRFCMMNQAARECFSIEKIVGKELRYEIPFYDAYDLREVIGVSENFHFHYPWREIDPLIMIVADDYYGMQRSNISIRLFPEASDQVMSIIENTVNKFFPNILFTYRNTRKEMNRIFRKSYHLERILAFSGGVSIFLAALGLAGFAEYEAGRKRKEIAIRKALGATRTRICIVFLQQLVPLILTANFLGWGGAFFLTPLLLNKIDYPYPFHMGGSVFIFSSSVTLITTVLAAGFRIFRAASINPADALRDE